MHDSSYVDLADSKGVIFTILLGFVGVIAFIPILTYFYFAKDLSSRETIMNRNNTGVILLDRNGTPFFKFYEAHLETYTLIDQIPLNLQQAVIAAEDKDFYHHPGFSPTGIIGAFIADVKNKQLNYGGSTITQQLVKNLLLNSKRSFLRKYQEVVLAQELERRYKKNQILEMYLNSVYFGEGAFGIEQASEVYFGKSASQLDLAESSILAAVLPAPSVLSPISGDLAAAKKRQNYVLGQMVEQGYINETEKSLAINEQLDLKNNVENFHYQAPHFALYIEKQLIDKYGEEAIARSGFKVKTTLDLNLQTLAEESVAKQVEKLKANQVSNGAAVVVNPKTGEILAMVGSKDWNNPEFGKVNIVTSNRQPGSSFKPIVYAAALEKQLITPATILQDKPTSFPEDNDYSSYNFLHDQNLYKPQDYDHKFRGPVTVRRALANSLNIPAVEVLSKLGIPEAVNEARSLGITSLDDPSAYGLSLTLGAAEVQPLEMAKVFSVFANQGKQNQLTGILEIEDKFGNKFDKDNPFGLQVISAETAFLISSILADNRTRAEEFGNTLNISREAAVKTGTTENYRDAWTIGYTPQVVVAVWVGNNNGEAMDQIAGSLGAAPIWRGLMEYYLKGKPVEKFMPPDNIVAVPICKGSGLRLREKVSTTSAATEYFIKGTEPTKYCTITLTSPSPDPSPP